MYFTFIIRVGHTVMSSPSAPHTISITLQVLWTLVRSSIALRSLWFRHDGVLFKVTSLMEIFLNNNNIIIIINTISILNNIIIITTDYACKTACENVDWFTELVNGL